MEIEKTMGLHENKQEPNFSEIVNMIESRKNNAYRKVNEELISLYWDFGKYISEKVVDSNWGDKIKDKLEEFRKREYPTMKGFNRAGIYRMKKCLNNSDAILRHFILAGRGYSAVSKKGAAPLSTNTISSGFKV